MRNLERKQDTRKKIQLGGLIKKAGLGEESTAVLLGILLDAKEKLEESNADSLKLSWKIKGDIALTSIKNERQNNTTCTGAAGDHGKIHN